MCEPFESIRVLWNAHRHRGWPKDLPGDLEEPYPLILDSSTAGCIQTFIANRGQLDAWRTTCLRDTVPDFDRLIQRLAERSEAHAYFTQLKLLGELVLSYLG